ncbi:MAG: hypothetical protein A2284_08165 [Deltaproteobacteria bacterium RIFOXYA12_FULL_61_11]|nr:MAG: hypothetical protein A2284_08165 [Deltaproteobacteria bacterium RIFOXYA12_FULL_61_11]
MLKTCLGLVVLVAFLGCKQQPGKPSNPADQPSQAPSADVLAVIDGDTITEQDLVRSINTDADLYQRFYQIYQIKKDILEQIIDERVITQEAKKEGKDREQFLNDRLKDKITVADEEVEGFYQNVKDNPTLKGTEEEKKQKVREYLSERKRVTLERKEVEDLKALHKIELRLAPPPYPEVQVSIEGDPVLGPADAPITIIEFSDFECPFCRRMASILKKVLEQYPGKIKLVFKDLPLTKIHPASEQAALASHCAEDQNKYWEYSDQLFESNGALETADLVKYATTLQLDVAAFSACLEQKKHLAAIEADRAEADRAGINATPTIIINNKLITGSKSLSGFKEIIDAELAKLAPAAAPQPTKP